MPQTNKTSPFSLELDFDKGCVSYLRTTDGKIDTFSVFAADGLIIYKHGKTLTMGQTCDPPVRGKHHV